MSYSKWYFFISVFLLSSCARQCTESALSDVEINDPSLLILEMEMYKSFDGETPDLQNLKVWVRDKNEQALTLLNGSVKANDVKLSIDRSMITKLPFYQSANAIEIDDGNNYIVDVELADGKSYSSSLSLPEGNISGIKGPNYHNKNEALTISWNKINSEYTAELTWDKQIEKDTMTITKGGSMIISSQTEKVFGADFFTDPDGVVSSVNFVITTNYNGKVAPEFRTESYFRADFWAQKTVVLQDPI